MQGARAHDTCRGPRLPRRKSHSGKNKENCSGPCHGMGAEAAVKLNQK